MMKIWIDISQFSVQFLDYVFFSVIKINFKNIFCLEIYKNNIFIIISSN